MKAELVVALESVGWPALLVDGGGRILTANRAAVSAFGPALAAGQASLSAIWSPENGAAAGEFLGQWEASPSPVMSLRYRLGGGVASFQTAISTSTVGGQKYYILQLLPDPVVAAAQKANASDAGAAHKQKLDCALQLARSVALDFNNALTSILGYTSLLLSRAEANHPWRKPLLEVEKSAAKAAEIANDLAAFSRQEKEARGGQTARNLNVIVQRCVAAFQNSQAANVTWQVQLERRLFSAKFDEAKIQQAFMKIIENAVESFKDGGRISVQTRNVRLAEPTQDRNTQLAAGAYVCVEVTDNGCGIGPDVLSRVFEPFFTTKKGAHRGLGLAWVYGIVTNHGGGVAVSSTTGAGTSVRVYLPAEDAIVRDGSDYADDLTGHGTILVVDDEDLLLTMSDTILSSYGYKVLTANSGQKALEIVRNAEAPIDLLLTDLVMPVMSGRELVEHVRRLAPEMRVMCTSGYVWQANQPYAAAFLQKPFTSQELLSRVKHLLKAETAQVD